MVIHDGDVDRPIGLEDVYMRDEMGEMDLGPGFTDGEEEDHDSDEDDEVDMSGMVDRDDYFETTRIRSTLGWDEG